MSTQVNNESDGLRLKIHGIDVTIKDIFQDGQPAIHFKCDGEQASMIYDYLVAEGFIPNSRS